MATTPSALATRVDELMSDARRDLAELVAFRSVFDNPDYHNHCVAAAQWVSSAFTAIGIDNETLVTSDGSTAVIGHRPGPAGSPTITLYAHHDVQPAGPDELWESDAFTLTERDGRWYARGAADCKGNLVAHLTALRAIGDDLACGLRIVIEGSEESGGAGLDDLARDRPELFESDMIIIGDAGNVAAGTPTLTTSLRGAVNLHVQVDTLRSPVHSGQFGGAAPDALAALIAVLATLRDEYGNTTIDGVDTTGTWAGEPYEKNQFHGDATILDGVDILGSGSIADMIWARPAVTVIALDAPATTDAVAAVRPRATAVVNLRIPPGDDPDALREALIAHLHAHLPWHARLTVTAGASGAPFAAATDGPMYAALTAALRTAYHKPVVFSGQGGSIPLCTVLSEITPHAEIALLGVEEPRCRIHAPNESVDPEELRSTALAEALFLQSLGSTSHPQR